MNLALVEYTDADAWDAFVTEHPHGHLLQRWAWGALKAEFGWRALRLAVVDSNEPRAAAQLLIRRSTGLAVCYAPRGPMFSGDSTIDNLLIEGLRRVARRQRAIFLRLEPNVLHHDDDPSALHSQLLVSSFRVAAPMQPRTSIHLSLEPEPDRLFAGFSKGHRADVRRAEREGVFVRIGSTAWDFDMFYTIMQTTATRGNFGIHSRQYYRRAWELFGQDACLLIAEGKQNGPVAAFLVFASGAEAQYMYSGSTSEGLKSGANHLLQWHAIRWARERGCRMYDFWGIPDIMSKLATATPEEQAQLEAQAKEHPLYGVYRFKKGWGGAVVRYLPAYDQVYLPPAYWLWQRRSGSGEGA